MRAHAVGCEVRNGEIGCSFPQRQEPVAFENVIVLGETLSSIRVIFADDKSAWIPRASASKERRSRR
jgi:hypothetical protein